MAFCENCGNQLKPQGKFCESCGTPVKEQTIAEPDQFVEEQLPPQPPAVPPAPPVQKATPPQPPVVPPAPPVQKAALPPTPPPSFAAPSPSYKTKEDKPPRAGLGGIQKLGKPVMILAGALAVVLIGSIIGIVALLGSNGSLKGENLQLALDKEQLSGQLSSAKSTITGLSNDLNGARGEIEGLESNLNNANSTINNLNNSLSAAESDLSSANAAVANLSKENKELADNNNALSGDLADATGTISTLSSAIETMNSNYSDIVAQIDTRFGWGAEAAMQFVTSNDAAVAALVNQIVTPFDPRDWDKAWDDFRRLYNWIRNNVEYSYDTPLPILPLDLLEYDGIVWFSEFWQYPSETINLRTGDCEDQAILLASMINNYGKGSAYAYCITITNGDMGHMAVALPVEDGSLVIFDPAGGYYSSYWNGDVAFWDANTALKAWLNWWVHDMPGAEVVEFFDDTNYWEFDGNADFIAWITS